MYLLSTDFIVAVKKVMTLEYLKGLIGLATTTQDGLMSSADKTALDGLGTHNHDDRYYTEAESDAKYSLTTHNHDGTYSTVGHNHDGTYSPVGHNHDATYAPIVHTHDDRYFTETESDARFAPIVHDHDARYYTETEIDAAFAALSSTYAPLSHTHDDRYYTESEITTLLSTKANTNSSNTFTNTQTVQAASSSAQLKLERTSTSTGVGWLGADNANVLRVYNSALSEKAAITTTGRLKVSNQPAFSVWNPPASGTGVLVFGSVLTNRDTVYNTGTGYFTAPEFGVYVLNASVFIDTASSTTKYGFIEFIKNGVSTGPRSHSQYSATRSYETIVLTQVLVLNAGDNIAVYYTSGNGALTYSSGGYSSFTGFMLS